MIRTATVQLQLAKLWRSPGTLPARMVTRELTS